MGGSSGLGCWDAGGLLDLTVAQQRARAVDARWRMEEVDGGEAGGLSMVLACFENVEAFDLKPRGRTRSAFWGSLAHRNLTASRAVDFALVSAYVALAQGWLLSRLLPSTHAAHNYTNGWQLPRYFDGYSIPSPSGPVRIM